MTDRDDVQDKEEYYWLKKELGVGMSDLEWWEQDVANTCRSRPNTIHPALALGMGTIAVLNVGLLLSLPPVLMGRGAPYLPTFRKSMDSMFLHLRRELITIRNTNNNKKLTFVDLGSGDGRVVFRASREPYFDKCIGYEINPLLHLFATLQRLVRGPNAWKSTHFYLGNLWRVNLRHVHVVAVYGLGPIMKDLGVKLQEELPPGSYVLSNVFAFPNWKALPLSGGGQDGVYIYRTPECWNGC